MSTLSRTYALVRPLTFASGFMSVIVTMPPLKPCVSAVELMLASAVSVIVPPPAFTVVRADEAEVERWPM